MNHEKNECCKEKCLKGVSCDVKNCMYHDGDCKCTAKQISVGPGFASSSADTLCATFKQQKDSI